MGNSQSLEREYTVEQLKNYEKEDRLVFRSFDQFTDDTQNVQKALRGIESNTRRYAMDDEKYNTKKKMRTKTKNVEMAICSQDTDEQGFTKKDAKFFLKSLRERCTPSPQVGGILDQQFKALVKNFEALIRNQKRNEGKRTDQSVESDQKSELIMDLYSSNCEKMLDVVLMRLNELPPLQFFQLYSQEEMSNEIPEPPSNPDGIIAPIIEEHSENMEIEEEEPASKSPRLDNNQVFESSLILDLLNFCTNLTKDELRTVVKDNSSEKAKEINPSPSLRLTILMQRHLLFQASIQKELDSHQVKTLNLWCKAVFQSAKEILELALQSNEILQESRSTKQLNDQILQAIETSLVNKLLYELNLSLGQLYRNEFARFTEIQHLILEVLLLVDKLNRLIPNNMKLEDAYLNLQSQNLQQQNDNEIVLFESLHDYLPNSHEERFITFKGASHIVVTFDPRCSTEQGQDFLQLFKDQQKLQPFLVPYSGKPELWPKGPILMEGDSVLFSFSSESFSSRWGYRCFASPLYLHSASNLLSGQSASGSWLYYLEKAIGTVLRYSLMHEFLDTADKEEKENELWLDSVLFRGVIQQENPKSDSFVKDFIRLKQNSEAHLFAMRIEKLLPSANSVMEKMGGEPIDVAVRAYIITVIKHSGLLPSLITSGNPIDESAIVNIFLEGRKLRQWVASERREKLQAQDQMEEGNKKLEEEDFSYERFGKDILEKMELLLQFSPSSSNNEGDELRSSNPASGVTGKKRQYNNLMNNLRYSQDDPSILAWREMFATWKKIHAPRNTNNTTQNQSIGEIISGFAKKSSAQIVRKIIEKRSRRAQKRTETCRLIQNLVFGPGNNIAAASIHLTTLKTDFIHVLGTLVRSLSDSESNCHYLCGIRSSGSLQEASLKESFHQIYSAVVKALKDDSIHPFLRITLMNPLCINWNNTEDYDLLLKVLSTFHHLSNSSQAFPISSIASDAFRFLSLQTIARSKSSKTQLLSKLAFDHPIQKFTLESIFKDVESSSSQYFNLKRSPIASDRSQLSKLFQQEEKLFASLYLIQSIAVCYVKDVFPLKHQSSTIIPILVALLHKGNNRIHHLSCRLLRRYLVASPPSSFADLKITEGNQKGVILNIIERIGELMFVPEAPNNVEHLEYEREIRKESF
eukprot:TRINITY_DN1898_c0_g1_i2.p1 TRINITY_DN1898_c0_g1~~TRINITY_DN1898_c0_g1_i2.p1  ORF type:complete len:1177 (+),score=320.88 TRINITY_DN1898_c0_g1_i2:85-3531(+)